MGLTSGRLAPLGEISPDVFPTPLGLFPRPAVIRSEISKVSVSAIVCSQLVNRRSGKIQHSRLHALLGVRDEHKPVPLASGFASDNLVPTVPLM